MPYSARALGQEQLRLRSRRVRSNRSQRLSVWLAVVVLVLASLAGYFGASVGNVLIELPSLSLPGVTSGPSN
jgi:hypothetical protein